MKKETKEMILASLGTIGLVVLAIQANKFIVDPAINYVKGKMASKPTPPPAEPK